MSRYIGRMSHYRYILMDADGTFLDFASTERVAISSLFEHLALPCTDALLESYHKANALCWKEFEEGSIDMATLKDRRFSLFFESNGIDLDAHEAGRLFIRLLASNAYYIDGAQDMLSRLSKDHDIVVVTNGIAEVQRGRLERLDAMKYFHDVVISEEIGVQKPDPRFFDLVLSRLGASRQECLVVGDSLTSDIRGGLDSDIDTLYLHLGRRIDDIDPRIRFHASCYEEMLSIIDADKLDVEDE